MALNVTFNGASYLIPETGEVGWGGNTTSYLVAIAAGALQKTGGSFTLSAETDFGASFGIKSLYYRSRASNVASTGTVRLENTGPGIIWRNAANNGDLALTVNASDQLTYNGSVVSTSSIVINPGLQYQLSYYAMNGTTLSPVSLITGLRALQSDINGLPAASTTTTTELQGLHLLTSSRALVTDGSGILSPSPTTATELAFVSGVTSSLQTQINGKKTVATGNAYRFETTDASGNLQETAVTASRAVVTDSNGLPTASVTTATEIGFVNGVTAAIQTQLNAKEPTITVLPISKGGTNSGTALNNNRVIISSGSAVVEASAITASRVLVSNANGLPVAATTTTTEVNLLSGSTAWTTFTPTVSLDGAGTVPAYSTNSGRYYRLGNMVFVDVLLAGDGGADGSGTSQIQVALPVAASASIISTTSLPVIVGSYNEDSNDTPIGGNIAPSATVVKLWRVDANAEYAVLTGAQQNSAVRIIRLHFNYEV